MPTFAFVSVRVLAALLVGWMTGTAGLLVLGLASMVSAPPALGDWTSDVAGLLLESLVVGGAVGAALGAPTGIAIMFMTRAAEQPWRAVPILAAGTTSGFLITSGIVALAERSYVLVGPQLMVLAVGATIGGGVASRYLPRRTLPAP